MKITDKNIKEILEAMYAVIDGIEDGDVTNTYAVFQNAFPGESVDEHTDGYMKLHYGLDKLCKERGIFLEIIDEDAIVGMPYHIDYMVNKGYSRVIDFDADAVHDFVRLNKIYEDIDADTLFNITEPVVLKLEDLKVAAENVIKNSISKDVLAKHWIGDMEDLIFDELDAEIESDCKFITGLPSARTAFENALWMFREYAVGTLEDGETTFRSLESFKTEVIPFIEEAIKEREIDPYKRNYSDSAKSNFIGYLSNDGPLKKAHEKDVALLIKWTDELVAKSDRQALYAKAYGCYGGNRAFECDWIASRDCLIKLTEIDTNPFLWNTLGYIYYYGRCTDGVPEYDKAFYAYSIGAAGGVYESRYKLADMFLKGYGVRKNEGIASNIINELYIETLEGFLKGDYQSKFADLALRMGGLAENGTDDEAPDEMLAYSYYLQAREAIRLRRKYDYYGDNVVANSIDASIARIKEKLGDKIKEKGNVKITSLYNLLAINLRNGRRMKAKIKHLKDGCVSVTFKLLKRSEYDDAKLFVCAPEAGFCKFENQITVKLTPANDEHDEFDINKLPEEVIFDGIVYNSLIDYDVEKCWLHGKLTVKALGSKQDKKVTVVSVEFTPGGRTYDYISEIADVKEGDTVIVKTTKGESEVTVVSVEDRLASDLSLPEEDYKKILRKA